RTRQLVAATHGRSVFSAPVPSLDGTITYPVVLRAVGAGTVAANGDALLCTATCFKNVSPGTTINVDATPGTSSVFGGWRICPDPEGTRCSLTVDGPPYVTAVFPPPRAPETQIVSPAPGVSRSGLLFVRWFSSDARDGTTYDLRYRVAHARGSLPDYPAAPQHPALTTTTWAIGAKPGSTYCFEARTLDVSGLVGPWSDERCVTVPLDDRSLHASGRDWARELAGDAYDSTLTWTTIGHATLRARGLRATSIGLLAQ